MNRRFGPPPTDRSSRVSATSNASPWSRLSQGFRNSTTTHLALRSWCGEMIGTGGVVISPRIIDRNRRARIMNVTEPSSWWGLRSDPCKPPVPLSRTSIRIIATVILTLLYYPPMNFVMENREVSIWRTPRRAKIQLPVLGNWSAYGINGFMEYIFTIYSEIFKFAFIPHTSARL